MKSPLFAKSLLLWAMTSAVAGSLLLAAATTCRAQAAAPGDTSPVPQDLPPGVQDVVKLTQAGLNEDVIIAQLRSAGHVYRLTADQIIELTNTGVSQNAIKALIEGAGPGYAAPIADTATPDSFAVSAPPAVPAVTDGVAAGEPVPGELPAAPVNFDAFQSELSPYGMWVQSPSYGWVWVPSVATGDSNWQPYCDDGQWLYSDIGWYWNSFYPWGRIAFHYGRWARLERYGWGWVPDYTWGPCWVSWRHDEVGGYCGWAPLPPGAQFVAGVGLFFHGRLAVDIDFGLRWDEYVFCSYGHLLDRNLRPNLLPRERIAGIYDHTFLRNHYNVVNGRITAESLGRARMETLTHRQLTPVVIRVAPARQDGRERVVQPRTNVSGRRDTAPASRTAPRSDGRSADPRAPAPRSPPPNGGRAPAPEKAPAPAPANSGPAADQKR